MSTTVVAEKAVVEQPQKVATEVQKPVKDKKIKAPVAKKPKSTKTAAHPPYFQMIKEALLALNERTGSSPQAIAKSIEEKYKSALPVNFRKIMGLQLKNLSTKGKLIKIKASYKLSDAGKKVSAVKKPAVANAESKKKPASQPKKGETESTKKKVAAAKPVKKVSQTKKRAAPASAKAKQPKSIKSPAAKKAKKGTA